MKHKRLLALVAVGASALLLPTAWAAPLKKDPPAGYATELPDPDDPGVLIYEDFEIATGDATGRIGRLEVTVPEERGVNPPKIEITDEMAKNGTRCLKVSNRGVSKTEDGNSPNGYNTLNFNNVAFDISTLFQRDPNNKNKTENYFFTAWVRNVDPNVTQYFYPQMQYGGSGEVWLPDGDYYKVTGSDWTLVGGKIRGGKVYFCPFTEDMTGSGVYVGRQGLTSWSFLKLITHNPYVPGQSFVTTADDFYVDDIVFWRVADPATLTAELPEDDGQNTLSGDLTLEAVSREDSAPADTPSDHAALPAQKEPSGGLSTGAIIGICVGAAVLLALVALLLFWLSLRKKAGGAKPPQN